jgi:surface protein
MSKDGNFFRGQGLYGSPLPSGLERLRHGTNPRLNIPSVVNREGGTIPPWTPPGNPDLFDFIENTVLTTFAMAVDTTQTGSASDTFILPTTGAGYDATVDWGDGNTTKLSGTPGNVSHTYDTAGTYQITVEEDSVGGFPRIYFNNSGDRQKLISIDRWGTIAWTSLSRAFYGCSNMVYAATDNPDLTSVTAADSLFRLCSSIGPNLDLSGWSGNSITTWANAFNGSDGLTGTVDLTGLVTSSATNLSGMFGGFPQISATLDLTSWDVSNVTTMASFAYGTGSLTSVDTTGWNTGNVTNMSQMFRNNGSLIVTGMDNWDTGSVTTMELMLNLCNTQIPLLDPSGWDVTSLTNGSVAFAGAFGVGLPQAVYDATLVAWESQAVQNGVVFHFGTASKYGAGAPATARTALINDHTWTIIDGGAA